MSVDTNNGFTKINNTKMTLYCVIKYSDNPITVIDGKNVKVHVTGIVNKNNYTFWNTKDTNKPYTFKCGSTKVINVWNKCILGMKLGEIRKFIIPPEDIEFGYVGFPVWNIPPNCEITYIVEVLDIYD